MFLAVSCVFWLFDWSLCSMHLSGIYIYPVKSLRGIPVQEAAVDEFGLVGDRRFLVIDARGLFLTQRAIPRMALVNTALEPQTLLLSAEGAGQVRVSRLSDPGAIRRPVIVWKSEESPAEDCGDEVSDWLSSFLGQSCRLVRIGPDFRRQILERKLPPALANTSQAVSFADAYPFLVISENSLVDLNTRLVASGSPALPMNRFRTNLVVSETPAFEEDLWQRFRIGEIIFRAGGGCSRCIVTTTDQATAERGIEPLRTLATYRRDPNKPADVLFGQNLIHETKCGVLRVGDEVEVLA